ncbi:response regulator [Roseomonas xinghualingensis]|uniref:response regulator n=1 Tax=Roseomonas xinghualingensis TaxID=2986475 RepID=UPI00366B8CA3
MTGRRVLIVEDEFFIADDLVQALQDLGAEVLGPAPTRQQALDLLAGEERIDFAVLDVNLQGEGVFPVADALNARGVPFVIATGYARSTLPPRFQNVPHWEKPFDPDTLVRALASLN